MNGLHRAASKPFKPHRSHSIFQKNTPYIHCIPTVARWDFGLSGVFDIDRCRSHSGTDTSHRSAWSLALRALMLSNRDLRWLMFNSNWVHRLGKDSADFTISSNTVPCRLRTSSTSWRIFSVSVSPAKSSASRTCSFSAARPRRMVDNSSWRRCAVASVSEIRLHKDLTGSQDTFLPFGNYVNFKETMFLGIPRYS